MAFVPTPDGDPRRSLLLLCALICHFTSLSSIQEDDRAQPGIHDLKNN